MNPQSAIIQFTRNQNLITKLKGSSSKSLSCQSSKNQADLLRTYIIFRTCMCNVKCININHSYLEQAHLTLCLFALENKKKIEITIRERAHGIQSQAFVQKKSIFFFSVYLQHEDKSNNEFHHQLRKWRRWVINK